MPKAHYGAILTDLLEEKLSRCPEQRSKVKDVSTYLDKNPGGRVCAVCGLRRTGKTTMMLHAIANLSSEERQKSAYILAFDGDHIDDIDYMIEDLHGKGINKFFIDEITCIPEFIDQGNLFSDCFASRSIHIILSGTDSLSFRLAESHALFDRVDMIHTTWIPYKEHKRLIQPTATIEEYLMSGGILSSNRDKLFREYALEAIAENIQNSLDFYKGGSRFMGLEKLRDEDQLTSVINSIIQDDDHRFISKVIKDRFDLPDLSVPLRFQSNKSGFREFKEKWFEEIRLAVKHKLSIFDMDDGMSRPFPKPNKEQFAQISQYLKLLGLTVACPVINYNKLITSGELEDVTQEGRWILSQPGLRWAHIDVLLNSISDDMFRAGKITRDEKETLYNAVRSRVLGMMIEENVILETMLSLEGQCDVYPFRDDNGEIDIIVAKKDCSGFFAYEVKHRDKRDSGLERHLRNEAYITALESRFGEVLKKGVIYRGKTKDTGNIDYINVEDYLLSLPDYNQLAEQNILWAQHNLKQIQGDEEDEDDDSSPSP